MDPDTLAPRRRLRLEIEGSDVVAVIGASLVVVGACAFHWALGLIAIGGGLCGLAWRMARP